MAAPIFTDYSSDLTAGGDILHLPKMSKTFAGATVTATSGRISYQELSDSTVALTVDQWYYTAYPITDRQKVQMTNPMRWINQYNQDMGYELAETFDSALLALGASVTDEVGDSATDISATTIENAVAILDSNSVPITECAMILHPYAYWKEMMKSATLVDASKYGKAILPNPPHNQLFNIPVYITPQVPAGTAGTEGGHRNLIIHKGSLGYAFANLGGRGTGANVPVRVQIKNQLDDQLATKYVADVLYGTAKVQLGWGVRLISNN